MAEWYSGIEATVFTQLQYMLKKEYTDLVCKTTNQTVTPAEFPTLYLYEEQEETGNDLTNEDVNAVISTIYVRVWTNTTEAECKEILAAAVTELKRFHYNIRSLPMANLTDKIAYGEIMARRVIGAGDSELVK